ncbi:hypothetical protein HID58_070464 [Brassica napus]|uniref:Sucrose-phosphatase n=1 Tax=Brassica napus TaxID=3708 RepID=A0ABQ7YYU2_BRANA|nr:hypothetical protein HID58_070464 [Brassica napus]
MIEKVDLFFPALRLLSSLSQPKSYFYIPQVEHRNDNENHSLLRFNSLWEEAYRHDSLLVFSTGRAKTMYKKLRKARPLLTPDVIVTSVGTEISYGKSMVPDENWVEIMNNKWNRGIVEEETRKFPELTLQAETEQMPHKLSFHVDKSKVKEVTKELYQRLEKRGLEIKIIFSGGIALDVLPKGGGKGQALSLSANLNDPAGVFVHPSGAEKSLRGTIDELWKYHGDKKDKKFRVWIDQVLATETTHGTWIVKLDKWEQTGNERKCCTTTVKFTSKENEGFVWENVQQTWSEESEVKDDSTWII